MQGAVIMIFVSTLAGSAAGPDRQAAHDADVAPVPTQGDVMVYVSLPEPMEPTPAAQTHVVASAALAGQVEPVATIPDNAHIATPKHVAEPVLSSGAVAGAASDSPWDGLMRRVTAWANPCATPWNLIARMDRFVNPDNSESNNEEHS